MTTDPDPDPLGTGDRLAIHELVALHGHVMDDGAFDRLADLFTPDVAYDVTRLGGGVLDLAGIRDAGVALGDRNPLGHHVTNVVVETVDADRARVRSKGIAVMSDGTTGTVVYADEVVRTHAGWRIERRTVFPRRRPLHPEP